MYAVFLQRSLGKRTNEETIQSQIDHIIDRGMNGNRGKTWDFEMYRYEPIKLEDGNWQFQYRIEFEKVRGDLGGDAEYKQWEEIKAMLIQTGENAKYQPYPWKVVEQNEEDTASTSVESDSSDNSVLTQIIGGVRSVQPVGEAKTWEDLVVPPELLGKDSDRHLSQHPAWKNLYGVNPQIRVVLSNIKRAQETNGESRNHAVLFGHAGCGKTTTMFALENMFGTDSVLKLDATSTTRAGIEKLFFSDLKDVPPLVFMEEAEKADPEALKIWLGALDDRGEIRKVNFRVNQLRQVKVLFICTVNNKTLFDRMMGSDGSEAGALSSRCVTQVYYPRPSQNVLLQILSKEIHDRGGDEQWIAPAINLAQELKISDPRIVRSFLAGGDRLLDGTYQRDWQDIYKAQQAFNS